MGRDCKVDLSPHRTEYDQMRLKGMDVKAIWMYSRTKYNEDIGLQCFYRHFRNHLEYYVKEGIKASKLREDKVKEEVDRIIDTAKMLRKNLEVLYDQYEVIKDQMMDEKARNEMRNIINRANQTVELILRFIDKMELKEPISEEDIFRKVIKCLEPEGRELQLRFIRRWKTLE